MESKRYQIYSNKIKEDLEKDRNYQMRKELFEYKKVIAAELAMPKIVGEEYIKGYVKDVLDNYNNMSIEDRLKVNEILEKFYKDNREYCYSHDYTFKHINTILKGMLNAKEFPKLLKSLDDNEWHEMNEQILLACTGSSPFDYICDRNLIDKMLELEYTGKTEEPTFTLDEERLKEELADDEIVPNDVLNVFKVRYSEAAINEVDYYKYKGKAEEKLLRTYAKPLAIEFKNIMNETIDYMLSNISYYACPAFRLKSLEDKILIIFNVSALTKEDLDLRLAEREERMAKRAKEMEEKAAKEMKVKAKRRSYKNNIRRKSPKGRR